MRRHRIIGWLAVGMAVWSAGCAAPRVTRSVYQTGEAGKAETFVRLDQVDTTAQFDHPVEVAPGRMKELLTSVAVRKRTGLLSVIFSDNPFRAFSDPQVDLLSAQLSKALAEASPKEMALFYFNAPEAGEQLRVTSGGVYVRQGELVVIMANYRYTAMWNDQGSGRPFVSVSAARGNPLYSYPEGSYQLVIGNGQARLGGEQGWFAKLFGGSDRSSGVVLSLNEPPAAAEPESAGTPSPQAAAAPSAAEPQALKSAAPDQLLLPAAAASPTLQLHPPPAAAAPHAPAPSSIVPESQAAVSPLEEKLRVLKKLRDDGLITDADYEAKKQELLKNF